MDSLLKGVHLHLDDTSNRFLYSTVSIKYQPSAPNSKSWKEKKKRSPQFTHRKSYQVHQKGYFHNSARKKKKKFKLSESSVRERNQNDSTSNVSIVPVKSGSNGKKISPAICKFQFAASSNVTVDLRKSKPMSVFVPFGGERARFSQKHSRKQIISSGDIKKHIIRNSGRNLRNNTLLPCFCQSWTKICRIVCNGTYVEQSN